MYFFLGAALFPAHIAQSVEHILGKNEVIGSSPIVGSPVFVTMRPRVAGRTQTESALIRGVLLRTGCKLVDRVLHSVVTAFVIGRTQTARLIVRKESKEAFFQCPRQYLSGQSPM